MAENKSWAPRDLDVQLVGMTITGFHGDDILEVVFAASERVTTEVGPYGDTVRSYTENTLSRATFVLQAGCPADRRLRALLKARATGPARIKCTSDGTIISGATSYVEKGPDPKYAGTHQGRQWVIAIAQTDVSQDPA